MERAKRLELGRDLVELPATEATCVSESRSVALGDTHEKKETENPATGLDLSRPDATAADVTVFKNQLRSVPEQEQLNLIADAWPRLTPELRTAVLAICSTR